MIPKSDGDCTPLGQRPLCVLPVVYRVWASVRLRHLDGWLRFWLPLSVFSAGGGRGSVDAWYSTALDIEEVLCGLSESHVHVFVADVVKSFDTVDRGILDFVLGRLGFPVWFRRVYFGYHANVRLRFKLACGLGSSWTRDGGIPQGFLLSMVFIVALYLPWCRALESIHGVRPQLYADNLKCVSGSPAALLSVPRARAVVLPLDFVGRLRILRTMHLPGALHGAEASLVSISGLRKLRTAFCQASLSGGLRLANPGAVLSLLDGPVGSDSGFHVVWCRFRMLRRYMA